MGKYYNLRRIFLKIGPMLTQILLFFKSYLIIYTLIWIIKYLLNPSPHRILINLFDSKI
jgi:hypothetical protein